MKKLIIFILFSIVSFFCFSQFSYALDNTKNLVNNWLGKKIVKGDEWKRLQKCAQQKWKELDATTKANFASGLCHSASNCKNNSVAWVEKMIKDGIAWPITFAVYKYNLKSKQQVSLKTQQTLQKTLNYSYLLTWPLLVVGWKFLSNDFVYWKSFWIDNVLWQLWQTVRTFTNYVIWIIFIVSIFIYFFKSESNFSWKKMLPKIVIASIVVNASWFLFWVLIDLSTILTVAAWNIWHEFTKTLSKWWNDEKNDTVIYPITINTDNKTWWFIWIKIDGKTYYQCIYDKKWKIQNSPCLSSIFWQKQIVDKNWESTKIDKTKLIKTSDIDYNSAGQLVSLFRYMNTEFLNDNTNSSFTILFIIRIVILLILIIPFILLSVIFVIRVLVFWVVIPLSPALLWAYILWIWWSKVKENLSNIISLVFQPAYVVFMLSLWFILIQSVYTMMPGDKKNSNSLESTFWIKLNNNKYVCWYTVNSIDINWLWIIQSKYMSSNWWNTRMDNFKNIFSYFSWILVNLLAWFILWMLVFVALKSNKFTKKISETVETYTEKTVKTIPFLPWWQSISSLWKIWAGVMDIPSQKTQNQKTNLVNKVKKIREWDKSDDKNSWK